MKTFLEIPLSASAQAKLTSNGINVPTPVQAQSIPAALEGRDVFATAQTGTGKTLAFLLPILEKLTPRAETQALIVTPTRELAMQIMAEFEKFRHNKQSSGVLVVGGLSERPQIQAIKRGAQLVVATPGRLEDLMRRNLISLKTVKTLVLDEADRMLDMGFQPAIKVIVEALPTDRQTLFFSATAEPTVAHLVTKYLRNPVRVEVGNTSKPADSVQLKLYEVSNDGKLGLLQNLLKQELGSTLIFARTKHGTEKLAKKLRTFGIEAGRIHGDRTQAQRTAALQGFQQGRFRVLVATDVAARGIHVENIAHVVNYDLPQVPEDFIHRVGRTGRASATGKASTFATREQSGDVRRIEKALRIKLERGVAAFA